MRLIQEYDGALRNKVIKGDESGGTHITVRRDPHKVKNVCEILDGVIEDSDEVLLKMLLDGYENDIDKMLDNIIRETYRILYGGDSAPKNKFIPDSGYYIKELSEAVEEQMKIYSLSYFSSTVLNMEINWHHLEWSWLIEEFTMTCVLAARDHGKSFFFSHAYPLHKMYGYDKKVLNRKRLNGKKGILFSNTSAQVIELIETIKDSIMDIDELRERLYPIRKESWSKTAIKTKNGCALRGRSMNTSTRGAHPGYIILDDVLKDNVLYSKTQRERSKEFFNGSILPMLIPGGEIRVVGTPFHYNDLYALFRDGVDFAYREYPAIDDKGNLLWSNRHSVSDLEMRKRVQGTMIFTREYLVKPISDQNSLFPWEILKRSYQRNVSYINNKEAYYRKFTKVVTAGDFAISKSIGADYTVFVTFGIDEYENMWLLNIFRKKGMSFDEQKAKLKSIWRSFRSDVVMLEANQFQDIYVQDLTKETSMPIIPFVTTVRKNDLSHGVPGLSLLFENGKIRMPYHTEEDQKMTDIILDEFNNVTFTDKGVAASIGNNDDCVMSVFIARNAALYEIQNRSFIYDFIDANDNSLLNKSEQIIQEQSTFDPMLERILY